MAKGVKITAKLVKDISASTFSSLKERAAVDKKYVKVGIPASKTEPGPEGTPLALIGMVMEFGSPKMGVPERPTLRPGVRKGAPDFKRLNRVNLMKVLRKQMSADKALGQLGAMAVGKVQAEVRSGDHQALAAATIEARKARLSPKYRARLEAKLSKKAGEPVPLELDKPLIDTGHFIQGFTYELVDKESK
jgi:hypothetical protein